MPSLTRRLLDLRGTLPPAPTPILDLKERVTTRPVPPPLDTLKLDEDKRWFQAIFAGQAVRFYNCNVGGSDINAIKLAFKGDPMDAIASVTLGALTSDAFYHVLSQAHDEDPAMAESWIRSVASQLLPTVLQDERRGARTDSPKKSPPKQKIDESSDFFKFADLVAEYFESHSLTEFPDIPDNFELKITSWRHDFTSALECVGDLAFAYYSARALRLRGIRLTESQMTRLFDLLNCNLLMCVVQGARGERLVHLVPTPVAVASGTAPVIAKLSADWLEARVGVCFLYVMGMQLDGWFNNLFDHIIPLALSIVVPNGAVAATLVFPTSSLLPPLPDEVEEFEGSEGSESESEYGSEESGDDYESEDDDHESNLPALIAPYLPTPGPTPTSSASSSPASASVPLPPLAPHANSSSLPTPPSSPPVSTSDLPERPNSSAAFYRRVAELSEGAALTVTPPLVSKKRKRASEVSGTSPGALGSNNCPPPKKRRQIINLNVAMNSQSIALSSSLPSPATLASTSQSEPSVPAIAPTKLSKSQRLKRNRQARKVALSQSALSATAASSSPIVVPNSQLPVARSLSSATLPTPQHTPLVSNAPLDLLPHASTANTSRVVSLKRKRESDNVEGVALECASSGAVFLSEGRWVGGMDGRVSQAAAGSSSSSTAMSGASSSATSVPKSSSALPAGSGVFSGPSCLSKSQRYRRNLKARKLAAAQSATLDVLGSSPPSLAPVSASRLPMQNGSSEVLLTPQLLDISLDSLPPASKANALQLEFLKMESTSPVVQVTSEAVPSNDPLSREADEIMESNGTSSQAVPLVPPTPSTSNSNSSPSLSQSPSVPASSPSSLLFPRTSPTLLLPSPNTLSTVPSPCLPSHAPSRGQKKRQNKKAKRVVESHSPPAVSSTMSSLPWPSSGANQA